MTHMRVVDYTDKRHPKVLYSTSAQNVPRQSEEIVFKETAYVVQNVVHDHVNSLIDVLVKSTDTLQ